MDRQKLVGWILIVWSVGYLLYFLKGRLEQREVDGQQVKFIVDELVLTDPKVYKTPIKITATLRHRPDLQLLEYTCTDALWDEYLSERGLTLPDVDSFPAP